MMPTSYAHHRFPPVVTQHAVWFYLPNPERAERYADFVIAGLLFVKGEGEQRTGTS